MGRRQGPGDLPRWQGEPAGYRVHVFRVGGGWYVAVFHPKGHTCVCPPADGFADARRRARAWVEANPLTGG